MLNLTDVLKNYGISGEILDKKTGPLLEIITFQPAAGTKIKNLTAAAEDIRRELGVSSLRIEPAESGNAVLFEIPSSSFKTVDFQALLEGDSFTEAKKKYALPLVLGANIAGDPVFADLAKMPHLLVGGATGSGKSVGLNTFILSLIAAKKPSELKFVLIDPKKVEFSVYNNRKYLYCPVADKTEDAVAILAHLAEEMDKRYELFAESLVKNIKEYNEKGSGAALPYIVCVIDEFADLMATDKTVEKDVMRLAQKARAAGIHLILATQRPSVDVVTGVLKANFPTRLAYKTASSADSRTILDTVGAEDLIGRGDSLYLAADGNLIRLHGAYIADDEIEKMLAPYSGTVKPLPLPKKEETGKSIPVKKVAAEKPGLFKRLFRGWANLRQKDRDLIIRGIKYIFTFIVGYFSGKNDNTKRRR